MMGKKRKTRHWTIKELTMVGMLTAIMCISSYITIPLPFTEVGITAQTIVVNLVGMVLGPGNAAAVLFTWILLGIVGLPVFSGGTGGAARLAGPTGGYIIGYLVSAVMIAWFCRKVKSLRLQLVFLIVAGIPVVYLFGGIWMKLSLHLPWQAVLVQGVIPFIPTDIIKCFAAAALAKALRPVLQQK